ncbi:F-box domain containing protein [Trema orientale]|uniref:F-box domain containing protein n=1 Tax=Trema orientale TaxID=63057 RepID=A0A2P5EE74_TREOI|nr:F-box domain containing protein [Trema orientale]
MANLFPYLPEELVEIIISRLPADSLVRFKCVNKAWYSYICARINDPLFVAKNLHYAKKKPSESLLLTRASASLLVTRNISASALSHIHAKSLLTSVLIDDDDDGDNNDHIIRCVTEDLSVPLRWSQWLVAYHCDGIICLLKDVYGTEIVLCNPILREYKRLPESNNNAKSFGKFRFAPVAMGFGYDSVASDYKFVRVSFGQVKAEVYSLSTECWRQVKMRKNLILDSTVSDQFYNCLYFQGACYWTMLDPSLGKMIILCFDMCEEVFHIVPFPKVAYYSSLVVWNDSVALFLSSQEAWNSKTTCLEMWVMDDYFDAAKGTAYSPLTKRLVLGPLVDFPLPLRFWKSSDELLLEDGRDEKLLAYNLRTQKLRKVEVDGEINFPYCSYVKSLVSVNGIRKISTYYSRRSKRRRTTQLPK